MTVRDTMSELKWNLIITKNNMKYTLKNPTKRHIASINKDLVEAGAVDESGKIYEKVTLWKSDWPQDITNDLVVSGDVKETEKNGYKNFILYPERTNTMGAGSMRGGGASVLMKKKEESIGKFQDKKEENIEKMAAFRDATLLTVAWVEKQEYVTSKEIAETWKQWNAWLTAQLDNTEPPF
jgi:hypothetical protein